MNGEKLNVLNSGVPIYHYSYARNPALMKKKSNYFLRFWVDDKWLQANTNNSDFDYNEVDKLEKFPGQHPHVMKTFIESQDWEFSYDPSKSNMSFKDTILNKIEDLTAVRLFEYRNYKLKSFPKRK